MKRFIFLICFFSMSSLLAQESGNLPFRGEGQYKWLFLKVYDAKLWADKGPDIYTRELRLELKYSRSFKGEDIAKQSIKELVSAGNAKTEMEEWSKKLIEIFPDVQEGDVIEASYNPENGVSFRLNSKKDLGRITDLNFSKKFLDIWLGPKTTAPELRDNLLGKTL